MSLVDIGLCIEWAVLAAVLAYRCGRRRGRRETVDLVGSLLAEARAAGLAEGAALLQAITDQHYCTETECAIEAQRQVARWQ